MYRQSPPFCVQVELTEGCQLRCPFCGLNGIRGKENNFKFMTVETAEKIAHDMKLFKWNSRIEFAMHGEPTFNPDMIEIISIFRRYLPKSYLLMETNGGGLMADTVGTIGALFKAGLSTLAIDEYELINNAEKIFSRMSLEHNLVLSPKCPSDTYEYEDQHRQINVYDYPASKNPGNPHQRSNLQRLVRVRPISTSSSGTHATLNNHAGAGAPKNDRAAGKRCAKPFREMSVRWDGGVAICCNDWRGTVPIGNVNHSSMDEIWHDEVFYAARRKLYAGERDFGACNGCDATSYRPGLLPDLKGQVELELPSKMDEERIADAIKKGPMTTPVLRDWET